MTRPTLVILRPQPGAERTRERAGEAGWRTAVAPLFEIIPQAWIAPDAADFDAVMATSANALLQSGNVLTQLTQLPCYAVGRRTALEARAAGFFDIVIGDGNVGALADRLREDGRVRVLHLAGERVRPFDAAGLEITRVVTYRSDEIEPLGLAQALADEPIVLLHSPHAARTFAAWCARHDISRETIAVAAISGNAAEAAGAGWRAVAVAETPGDAPLLDAAGRLAERL